MPFVGAVACGGSAYYWFVQRRRSGVLDEHAAGRWTGPGSTPDTP